MLTVLFILIKAAFCVLRDGRGLNALESSEVDTQSSQRAPVFAGNRKKNPLQHWSKCSSAAGAAGRKLRFKSMTRQWPLLRAVTRLYRFDKEHPPRFLTLLCWDFKSFLSWSEALTCPH